MSAREASEQSAVMGFGAWWTIICLSAAYMLAFVDRTILSLMVDPIRSEFALSDTEVSLLSGFAFALFYATLGLPMGRVADVGNRVRLVVVGMALWSAATALCGAARSAVQLFIARVCVGVGEAALTPASYSLIADIAPRARLGLAMSLYAVGATLGGGLAMALGGVIVQWALTAKPLTLPFLGELRGWGTAFLVAALPGLALALVMMLTVREPQRRFAIGAAPAPTLGELAKHAIRHRRAFVGVLIGYSLVAVTAYGFVTWAPAYFIRVHDLAPVDIGLAFGLVLGAGASLAAILGGLAADALVRRGTTEAPVLVILATQIAHAPLLIAAYLASDAAAALLLFAGGVFVMSAFGGLQHATIQAMTPPRLRGQMAAIYLMVVNLVGLGLGPTLTAALSDNVFGGPLGVGQALATMSALCSPSAALILFATLRAFRRAVHAVEATGDSSDARTALPGDSIACESPKA